MKSFSKAGLDLVSSTLDSRAGSALANVQIVSLYFWPETAGSAPPISQMAEILAENGCNVRALTARPYYPYKHIFDGYRNGERDQEHYRDILITRLSVQPPQSGSMVQRLRSEGTFAFKAWRTLRFELKIDAVFTVCPSILVVFAVALKSKPGFRHVSIVHDIQSGLAESLNIGKGRFVLSVLRTLERFTLNRVDEIITLSPAMADTIRGLGVTTPIRIIPPTIDDEGITPQPEPDGPITLLYSGNLGRKQGLDQLLDLAALMKERQWPVRLIIRGDGNYRETLVTAASTRALDGVVRFEPFWPTETLSEGLASGHIHLVPQDPAGAAFAVPSKIYAIMAAGRPFICTAEPESPMDQIRRTPPVRTADFGRDRAAVDLVHCGYPYG